MYSKHNSVAARILALVAVLLLLAAVGAGWKWHANGHSTAGWSWGEDGVTLIYIA